MYLILHGILGRVEPLLPIITCLVSGKAVPIRIVTDLLNLADNLQLEDLPVKREDEDLSILIFSEG